MEECKDQESVQLSTTPDKVHHMERDKNTRKHHTHASKEVSAFPAGDHKAAGSRHETQLAKRIKRSTALELNFKLIYSV